MRRAIQRTLQASVAGGGERVGAIGLGMLILPGIEEADGEEEVDGLCQKVARRRVHHHRFTL